MSKKNIVFIISSLHGYGGTNRVASLLANGLCLHHNITILSRISSSNTYQLGSKVNDIKYSGNNLSFVLQCKKYINNNKPDVVIVHTMSKLTPAIIMANIKTKNIWSIEHVSYEFHNLVFKQLRRHLYKKVSKIITLTKSDAINYRSFHPNVTVMTNPTSLPLKNDISKLTSKTIVSIGRLTYQKGFDLLIEAWSLVESKHPNWLLNIYGEGEDRSKLEKMIADKSLNNITLKGLTNDVRAVYDTAAIYVMSSRFEGLPVVLIEAQSRGLPIVSFDCPSGPAEIVHHNIDGLLVNNGNIQALAESIIELIKDVDLRTSMSKQALKAAKSYQIDTIMQRWLYLLENS